MANQRLSSLPGIHVDISSRFCVVFLLTLVLPPTPLYSAEIEPPATVYWQTPIPLRSPPSPGPEACAACHAGQYSDWSGSRHAHAFSPGLLGQIVDYEDQDATACLACHAPLADQQEPLFRAGLEAVAANMDASKPKLTALHGVYCAVCHLRDGILQAPSPAPVQAGQTAHDFVQATPAMRDSRFCAACHQFDTAQTDGIKPLQNTFREWQDSPYAEQGKTCQSCHMPDKAHRFRGIHDPDTVRRGLTITTRKTDKAAALIVRSTGIGHYFPTYIVPRIRLTGTLVDSHGQPLPGGYTERVLQREMSSENGNWIEHSDTRLAPGEAEVLIVPWHVGEYCGSAAQFRIIIEPEWFYQEKVYPPVLEELEDGPARTLIKKAKSIAETHNFILFEASQTNDCID